MNPLRQVAPWLLAVLAAAGTAPAALACTNSVVFPLQTVLSEPAQVGMVGHVDNGTVVDGGSLRAEIVVDQALLDTLTASLAGSCSQYVHQVGLGNITLLGTGQGEYSASTEVLHQRPGGVLRRRLAPVLLDAGSGATGGVVDHPYDPRLNRVLVSRVRLGDVIAIETRATATGTIIDGWVADQVQVLYTWSSLTPTLEIRVP